MNFAMIRKFLFQVHMWVGLVLGLLLVLLGLSGSALVYDDAIANFLSPPPRATAQGAPLPLDAIVAAAREAAGRGPATVTPAEAPGEAAIVRIGNLSRMGSMPGMAPSRGTQVYVDPVSGQVLGTAQAILPPILTFAHQLHGNFLMGRDGRRFVGWLGLAMVILGISGLVLWWPKRGQWKYAFIVRRTAKGLRFHRELHAMVGIWAFIVFMMVSFSGVVLAWPQTMGAPVNARVMPSVEPTDAAPIGVDKAVALALAAVPGATLRLVTLPAKPDQPINVGLLSNGAIAATVLIDPYRAQVMTVRDPSESFMAWQRPLHDGSALGPIWRALVCLSGLLPALFVFTGVVMWLKKRQSRIAMNAPLTEEAA